MKKLLILTLGLGMTITANADVYLGKHEGYEYYLLTSYTKKVSATKYEITMDRFVARDVKKDGIAQGGYTEYKRYIDCHKRQVGTISYKNFNKEGKLLSQDKMNTVKYYDIFPNSWGSALYAEVCR